VKWSRDMFPVKYKLNFYKFNRNPVFQGLVNYHSMNTYGGLKE
jgi:hypothetical protein